MKRVTLVICLVIGGCYSASEPYTRLPMPDVTQVVPINEQLTIVKDNIPTEEERRKRAAIQQKEIEERLQEQTAEIEADWQAKQNISQHVARERNAEIIRKKSTNEVILQRELESFFMDIPEVVWCKFVGNSIYVGFEPYPYDGKAILRGAALHGNKAINFGCHVWAVHADQKNNPPHYGTFSGKWYDAVTARYGRIK